MRIKVESSPLRPATASFYKAASYQTVIDDLSCKDFSDNEAAIVQLFVKMLEKIRDENTVDGEKIVAHVKFQQATWHRSHKNG